MNVSEPKWQEILRKHNQFNPSFRFSPTTLKIEELKAHCDSYFSEDENDPKYEIARRWCVEPNIAGSFLYSSFGLLSLDLYGGQDSEKWKKLEAKYRATENEKIPNWDFSRNQDNNTWQELQLECKRLYFLKPWENDYDVAMTKLKLWCTEEFVPRRRWVN